MASGTGVILLHAGAGYHSLRKESEYKALCNLACSKGVDVLRSGGSASDAAVQVIQVLENSPLTNSGIGSSLTMNGKVQCDAMITSSDGNFGAVGCLQNVKNPIAVAQMIMEQQKEKSPDGRIRPCCLVGPGARRFAQQNGVQMVETDSLITETTRRNYHKYRRIVDQHRQRAKAAAEKRKSSLSDEPLDHVAKHSRLADGQTTDPAEDKLLDTVGVISIDKRGQVVSALSSGGIALKRPGRVGQAMMIGSGCWATHRVAVATTGCGEQLIRTLLARELARELEQQEEGSDNGSAPAAAVIGSAMERLYINSDRLRQDDIKLAGAIAVRLSADCSNVEMLWTHTTKSMCVGYMSTGMAAAVSTISRLDVDAASCTTAGADVAL